MLSGIAQIKALKELKGIVDSKAGLSGLALIKALKRQNELRLDLGMGQAGEAKPGHPDNTATPANNTNIDTQFALAEGNPVYQSIIDGAEPSLELLNQLKAEAIKDDPSNPQLLQAVQVMLPQVQAQAIAKQIKAFEE